MRNQKNQVLLLDDVEPLGRSGDIVTVKPGYARNFLLPKKKAVVAQKHLVRLQKKLKEERAKKSASDKKESETLVKELSTKVLKTQVKIDAAGHMYGSVTHADIVKLFKEQLGIAIERRNVILAKPIKKMGMVEIELKFKEGVRAKIQLEITPAELG